MPSLYLRWANVRKCVMIKARRSLFGDYSPRYLLGLLTSHCCAVAASQSQGTNLDFPRVTLKDFSKDWKPLILRPNRGKCTTQLVGLVSVPLELSQLMGQQLQQFSIIFPSGGSKPPACWIPIIKLASARDCGLVAVWLSFPATVSIWLAMTSRTAICSSEHSVANQSSGRVRPRPRNNVGLRPSEIFLLLFDYIVSRI